MLKWDLEMQSIYFSFLLLSAYFVFFYSAIYSLLFTPEEKKQQSRSRENIKAPTPRTNTCQSNLSLSNSLKDYFPDDISDRLITHSSPGCAQHFQQDICQCIWDVVALILVEMR